MPFQPGQLAGDYEVIDVLGRGGMGRVYRVRNIISDRTEAMKVLIEDIGSEPGIGDRFMAEIRTLARLDHPNIAKLNTAFKHENQLVMVMELVDGVNLADRAKEGPIPVHKILVYIQQVLAALGYAHGLGVVHRDIKPSNIMLTPQGVVKLMDFGIAKSNAEPLLTQPGTTMGSLQYMSPEQVQGMTVDARSDLYSVGIVLYELTAGRRPFEAESTYQILDAQLNSAPPAPIEFNPTLPPALNEIILTALNKNPAKRFQNAEAFKRVLEHVAAADPAGLTAAASVRIPAAGVAPHAMPSAAAASSSRPQYAPPSSAVPPDAAAAAGPPQYAGAAAQAGKPGGRRSMWMAAGAVACLCVAGAAMIALPHFRTGPSAATSRAPVKDGALAATPTGEKTETVVPPVPPASPEVKTEIKPDNKLDQEVIAKLKKLPNGSQDPNKSVSLIQIPVAPEEPAAPPAAAPQTPPIPAGPSEEDVDNASEELAKMRGRVDAVNQGLASLKQQQAAQGFGLRGDVVASESRMYSYFQQAERAIQGRNVDLAQKNMDRTEQELSKLEKFLGR